LPLKASGLKPECVRNVTGKEWPMGSLSGGCIMSLVTFKSLVVFSTRKMIIEFTYQLRIFFSFLFEFYVSSHQIQ
jgi:hypothetical protein